MFDSIKIARLQTGQRSPRTSQANVSMIPSNRSKSTLGGLHAAPRERVDALKKSLFDHACDFVEAGLCLVPVRTNGSKKADVVSWDEFKTRMPTCWELAEWFAKNSYGAAILCGVVSFGVECIDFDLQEPYWSWYYRCEEIARWLPIVESPNGFHIFYRCSEVGGNRKLAMDARGQTIVDLKGEGGLVNSVLCPDTVHPSGRCYVQMQGPPLPTVPIITPEQRRTLLREAIKIDQRPPRIPIRKTFNGRRTQYRDPVESAAKYVDKMEPATSGVGGHNQTFKVACKLVGNFGLSFEEAMSIMEKYNERCQPPWSQRDLVHKLQDAAKRTEAHR